CAKDRAETPQWELQGYFDFW
nr:immunoglobulin heavy chain junction region [Macaca mulatta]